MSSEQEWTRFHHFFNKKYKLIDGTIGWGVLMRRKVNGEWQYRALTDQEEIDENAAAAW